MKNLLTYLAKNNDFPLIPTQSESIIFAQKTLKKLGFSPLPQELADFLHHQNGFKAEDCRIFGIFPEPNNLMDIVNANIFYQDKFSKDQLLIAENTFDFLLYDTTKQIYKIIDKQDFNVLEEYKTLEKALENIIKI